MDRDNELDNNEPNTVTKLDGSYTIILTKENREHKNYLNKTAPLVVYGGKDIRTQELFEDYLMALRDDSNLTYITPFSTLIAQTVFDELEKTNSNKLQKTTEERLSSLKDKISEIKKNLAELFGLNETIINKNPIELAKSGDNTLLSKSLQLHKSATSMKRAMKRDVRKLKKSILKSYRSLAKGFKKLKKTALKNKDEALLEVVENSMNDSELFDANLVKDVKKETIELVRNINSFWRGKEGTLTDNDLSDAIKEGENRLNVDTTKPIITLIGESTITLIEGTSYTDSGATALDNIDGDISSSIQINNPLDTNLVGTYNITYNVSDSLGNIANQVIRTVIVKAKPIIENTDTIAPSKPTLTTTPTTTTNNTQNIEVNGEVGATVWVNAVQKGIIGDDGKTTINLDTSGADGDKSFSIVLKDASANASEALLLSITKRTPPTVVVPPQPISSDPIFSEFNVGIGGSSSFPFTSNTDNSKIWMSIDQLLLNDTFTESSSYQNIKNFKPEKFEKLQGYVNNSKFMVFWLTDGWKESWFNIESIQNAMDAGHIPVFSYWYFGDRLLQGMPNAEKKEKYEEDNLRVANFLKKLNGKKMLIMEPEFNKAPVLESEETQHEFASIISKAIDTIKAQNPELLFTLSMMDIGSRGVNETLDKCGYENCALGDKYAWSRSDIVFDDLIDKLDFISFHQMVGKFSRDPANPGSWDSPNIRVYNDEDIGIDFLAERVSNMSQYLHEKYNKPVFLPYVTVATATWEDKNSDDVVDSDEINYYGWENKANSFYKRMAELRPTLQDNGLFGFAPMALFDNPRHDYGGYQYFMQNEYHLGIMGTGAKDEVDVAPDGDLYFKGKILDYIYDFDFVDEDEDKDAIFISPNGDDKNDGSYDAPLKDTKKICSKGSVIDKNIYFREGVYDNFPMIQCSGTKDKTVEIKPWANEKVKFTFDGAVGIRLSGNYVKLSGIEVKGVADKITYEDALANWWRGDKYYNGSGIVLSGHHIEVSDSVVHDAPGSGISAKGWAHINIHNNIVYNCDWWTIAGSKGVGVTDVNDVEGDEANASNVRIENNLIFNVESRIFSRVWAKGFAHLEVDEGEGILVQTNNGDYSGRYVIKNNFLLYTGKGVVVNKTDRADVENNTLYDSGTTIAGKFRGVRASVTTDSTFKNNAVDIHGSGQSFNMGKSNMATVTLVNNCGNGEESLDGVTIEQDIFADPANLDFTPQNGCKGANMQIWNELKDKLDEYGIEIKPTNWVPDYTDLTRGVIEHIPDGSSIDWSTWSDTEPFDLEISDIPNEDVKGRPNEFRLEVEYPYSREEIAHLYATATQGTDDTYFYYRPAKNAIDNNDSTSNQTRGGRYNKNWLQIELLDSAKIYRVVVQNHNSLEKRLLGAKVYLSNTPYSEGLNSDDLVYTLLATRAEQIIEIDPIKSAKYIIIKGEQSDEDEKHLHLKKVEVYGQMPQTPKIKSADIISILPSDISSETDIGKIDAVDYQGDNITYSISEDVPFTVDENGNIKTTEGIESDTTYNFDVTISDGVNSSSRPLSITVASTDVIEDVLKSGDVIATPVTKQELIDATLNRIESVKTAQKTLLEAIYGENSIVYDPKNSSQYFTAFAQEVNLIPILRGEKSKTLAIAGEDNGNRYLLFGSKPYDGANSSYEPYLNRLFLWLVGGLPIDESLKNSNKTVAYLSLQNNSFIDYMPNNFSNWTLKNCTNESDLTACIDGVDLVVFEKKSTNKVDAIAQMLDSAKSKHIPVAYFYHSSGENSISDLIEEKFTIRFPHGGNWWTKDKVDVDNYSNMLNNIGLYSLKTLFEHMKNRDFEFDWKQCQDSKGNYSASNEKCYNIDGINEAFYDGAKYAKNLLKNFDDYGKDVFLEDGYKLQKLLALTADKIRQEVTFPMDKVKTDDNVFMESYYADYANYYYRKINHTQPDLGNFSRSDFSHITPTTKTVSITSKTPFRATGAYALPGQTVKITRLDSNSSVEAKVFINSLRYSSTHEFKPNRYKRPKFLKSNYLVLKPNQTVYMTSPYGGPIEIWFNKNEAQTSFKIENIGLHTFWSEFDTDTDKDSKFTESLANNEFDWAEVVTSAFEVHSTRENMLKSIANFRWENISKLAEATKTYSSSNPMALAGFKGPGIKVIDEAKDFAESKDIPIYNADFVKHMNADQSTCGYGCSGNPYDAYWSFDPIGHGDIHEVGHSLERRKFMLKGWDGHSRTNLYAYYTQSEYNRYVEKEGLDSKYYILNKHVPKAIFKRQYEAIQNCYSDSNKTSCMQPYWNSTSYRGQSLLLIQAMMQGKKYATGSYALENGFHLLTRLHMLERHLDRYAQKNTENWDNEKDKLCFDNYSLDEIKKIPSKDWLSVSLSCASGIDFRPFFDMYGIDYSTKASAQIDALGFTETAQSVFFVENNDSGFTMPNDEAGAYLGKDSVVVDGDTEYPY